MRWTARTLTAVPLCMGAPLQLHPDPPVDRRDSFLSTGVELEPWTPPGHTSSGDRHDSGDDLHSSHDGPSRVVDAAFSFSQSDQDRRLYLAEEPTATATADMIEPFSASGRTDAERHAAVGSTYGAHRRHSLLKRTMLRPKKSEVQGSSFYGSKQAPPTPLRSKQNHHHDDDDAQLSLDLSRDAFALSVIRFIGDLLPWGSPGKGMQQWCLSTRGLGVAKCVDGLNVKREEVVRQLETKRQKYAFLFKPFRVEGEELESAFESASSMEGGETTMLLERPKTKKDTKGPDGKPQFPSPPGLLVVASEYNARRHQHDVETGVGKKGADNSREILCLTTAKENSGIPHGGFKTQKELEHAWNRLLPDPDATQDKRSAGPLAVRWMKDPKDCLRVRFFPLDRKEAQDGQMILGKRNAAWQLRAVLPKEVEKKHAFRPNIKGETQEAPGTFYGETRCFCVDGTPGAGHDRLMLWGCAPEQGRLEKDDEEEWYTHWTSQRSRWTSSRWRNMIRHQRWGVFKLDAARFPDAFLPTDEMNHNAREKQDEETKRNKKADHSNADGMGTSSRGGAVDHSAEVEKGASSGNSKFLNRSAGPKDHGRRDHDDEQQEEDDDRPAFPLLLLAGIFVAAAACFFCLGAICVLGCYCRPRPESGESAWSNSSSTATASSGRRTSSAALLSAGDEFGATNAAVTAAAVAEPKKKMTKKKGGKASSPTASGTRRAGVPREEAGAPVVQGSERDRPSFAHKVVHVVAQNHVDHGEEIEVPPNRKTELEMDSHGALSFGY